ncbi:MAG: AarF/ABC1/UbiB kinase family protein, partial [Methanobacteriota archaeon]
RVCDFCMQKLHGVGAPDGLRIVDPTLRSAQDAAVAHAAVRSAAQQTVWAAGVANVSASVPAPAPAPVVAVGSAAASGPVAHAPTSEIDTSADAPAAAASTTQPLAQGEESMVVAKRFDSSASDVLIEQHFTPSKPQDAVSEVAAGTVPPVTAAAAHTAAVPPPRASVPPRMSMMDAIDSGIADAMLGGDATGGVSLDMALDEAAELPAAAVTALTDRIQELESKLEALTASVDASSLLPEHAPATVESVLLRNELTASLLQPLLLALTLLSWRIVPLVSLFLSASYLLDGRWLVSLLWLAFTAWLGYNGLSSSSRAQLFRRRMRVYGAALISFLDYRVTRMQVEAAMLDDEQSALVWEAAHRRNAVRTFRVLRDLRGLWVKCGQYLSSRPDVMPAVYIKILAALQDAMPARPLEEVRATIEEDLGKPIHELFARLDDKALAAASIGQVHRGTLADGTEVAVKVQHRGMDVIINQDLDNLKIILSWLSWVETGFDVQGVMSEWLKEVGSELDFMAEAANMTEVRNNMMATDLLATVPRVIPRMHSRRVLVMRFIEGVKVNNLETLIRLGVNRDVLCSRVCHAYAHQIYRNGFFNGDPHPGNIMVVRKSVLLAGDAQDPEHERIRRITAKPSETAGAAAAGSSGAGLDDEWIPVLLDFGLTKRLPEPLRMAFAKLVV